MQEPLDELRQKRENYAKLLRKKQNEVLFNQMRCAILHQRFPLKSCVFQLFHDTQADEIQYCIDKIIDTIRNVNIENLMTELDHEEYLRDLLYLFKQKKLTLDFYLKLKRDGSIFSAEFVSLRFMNFDPEEVDYWMDYMEAQELELLLTGIFPKDYKHYMTRKVAFKEFAISVMAEYFDKNIRINNFICPELIQRLRAIFSTSTWDCDYCFFLYISCSLKVIAILHKQNISKQIFQLICHHANTIKVSPLITEILKSISQFMRINFRYAALVAYQQLYQLIETAYIEKIKTPYGIQYRLFLKSIFDFLTASYIAFSRLKIHFFINPRLEPNLIQLTKEYDDLSPIHHLALRLINRIHEQ